MQSNHRCCALRPASREEKRAMCDAPHHGHDKRGTRHACRQRWTQLFSLQTCRSFPPATALPITWDAWSDEGGCACSPSVACISARAAESCSCFRKRQSTGPRRSTLRAKPCRIDVRDPRRLDRHGWRVLPASRWEWVLTGRDPFMRALVLALRWALGQVTLDQRGAATMLRGCVRRPKSRHSG